MATCLKNWKIKRNPKLKGAFGETDYDKKTISVNVPKHKAARKNPKLLMGTAQKDNTVINTLVHEMLHVQHPNMKERAVRKTARKKVTALGEKQKKRLLSKLS